MQQSNKSELLSSLERMMIIKGKPKVALQTNIKLNPNLKHNLSKKAFEPAPLHDSQEVLQQIQEENARLQQQVNQNGQLITSLIQTLEDQDLSEEVIIKLNQAKQLIEAPKKVFKKTFRIKSKDHVAPQSRSMAPQSVGTNRPVYQISKPRILKTSHFNNNNTPIQGNSSNDILSSFGDINNFTTVADDQMQSTVNFYDEGNRQPPIGYPSKPSGNTLKPLISHFSQINKDMKEKKNYLPNLKIAMPHLQQAPDRKVLTEQVGMESLGNMTFQKSLKSSRNKAFEFPKPGRRLNSEFNSNSSRENSIKSDKPRHQFYSQITIFRQNKNKDQKPKITVKKPPLNDEISFEQFKDIKAKSMFPRDIFNSRIKVHK